MDVMEAIRVRRSIRAFKPAPVSDEDLAAVLEAGRLAPSWKNSQVWRFVVVREEGTKRQLAEQAVAAGNPGCRAVQQAPVVIAACAELARSGCRDGVPETDKGDFWYMFDVALAMENMALAALSFGLGTLFIGRMDAAKAAEILQVPPGYACVVLMCLGHPDEAPAPRPRKALAEIAFADRFGREWS